MGDPKGFIDIKRTDVQHRPVGRRIKDYNEVNVPHSQEQLVEQAARCMDCGIPFCHTSGCPLNNRIPEFNDMVYKGRWEAACKNLHSTNNFPEFTGRVCPAPCEQSCTLNVNSDPVLIEHIEYQIVEKGFEQGWIVPLIAEEKTGKSVAVVGSGPAGLACAQQLAREGHKVDVYEKSNKVGGLLRYGIPDFKLDKKIIDRRMEQMIAEGVHFITGIEAGKDISVKYLKKSYDAVCITAGAGVPRDLNVEGRNLDGIHFAMSFLSQQNKRVSDEPVRKSDILAGGKNVVVIGGGDTGSDCVGTSIRHGAKSVTQIEIMPRPPEKRDPSTPWPLWPNKLRTSSSQEEGCERMWSILTKAFKGDSSGVKSIECCKVEWTNNDGKWSFKEVEGSDFELKAELVLLSMGFVHVKHDGLVSDMTLELDERGNIKTDNYQTSQPWVFAAGDASSGASLVVRAIDHGRKAAAAINTFLKSK
ncbi:MAG: glutamate synthase subunit beta [Deltaproteobacteria bacterium]|nr:glutamate synthase subunit beta [Deltaproteobacteria bacterium]